MTTMEKPQSKKAKKFNFSGTQNHGDAAQRKGHQADGYYWETRYDQRGKINTDKTYLKEVIRDGLNDEPTPAELEAEADRILAEAEAEENVDDFEGRRSYAEYEDYDEDGMAFEEYLKFLQAKLNGLKEELSQLPHLTKNDPDYKLVDEERLTLEGETMAIIAAIRELLNENDYPEAVYGVESKRDIRNRLARTATLDDYNEDDFGDSGEKPVHIRKHR